MSKLITIKEMQEYLRIGRSAAYQMIHRKSFQPVIVQVSERKTLIDVDRLNEWLKLPKEEKF